MGRRGDFVFIISVLLLVSPMAYAWDSQASVNIGSIYETNGADFILSILNPQGNDESINNISVQTSGFDISSVEESSGWQSALANNVLSWDIFLPNGFEWLTWLPFLNLGISSDAGQNFRFNARAQKIDQDTVYSWPVASTFHDSTNDVQTVAITVLNDYTGPALNDWTPVNGDYIKEGTDDLPASINATDPETGVLQAFFNYIDCADAGNSSAKTSLNLTKNGDVYSDTADVSYYDDSTQVCFSFIAENNGGAFSNESGFFTIDGIAPVVTLIAPDNGAIMNALSNFEFLAQDNLAPTMDCDLYSDSAVYATVTADNNINAQVNADSMPEGTHNWSVACTDIAGWTGFSEDRTYILDKTPPNITLNSPADGAIVKAGTIVDISVTDNVQLADVSYILNMDPSVAAGPSIILNTSGWADGPTVIQVTAADAAGNVIQENFVVIIDKFAPGINLTSPSSGDTLDYHVQFVFETIDNYDPMIDCGLYVDDVLTANEVVNTSDSVSGVVEQIVSLGDHSWYVTCIDDAENLNTSQTWNFTAVDITGPDITVNDIGAVVRGNTAQLNISLYDISGIDESSIIAQVTDPDGVTFPVAIIEDNGYYIGVFATTVDSPVGNYIVTVYAEDNLGNNNTGTGNLSVTYSYDISINLNPNPALSGEDVVITGSVRLDNGSLVPDDFITLVLPDTTIQAAIDSSTGAFTHVVSYSAGQYDIRAEITPDNGITFSATETLTVNNPSGGNGNNGGNGGSSGGGGSSSVNDESHTSGGLLYGACGDGSKDAGEDCSTCPADAGCSSSQFCDAGTCRLVEDENECDADLDFDANNCGECGKQCPVNKICSYGSCIKQKECDKDNDCGNGQQCNNGECVGQQDEDEGIAGRAFGFLNLKNIRSDLFWWVALMLLAIIFVLTYMRKRGLPGFRKEDELGLDEYLNRKH